MVLDRLAEVRVRMALAMASDLGLTAFGMDITQAFLRAPIPHMPGGH